MSPKCPLLCPQAVYGIGGTSERAVCCAENCNSGIHAHRLYGPTGFVMVARSPIKHIGEIPC